MPNDDQPWLYFRRNSHCVHCDTDRRSLCCTIVLPPKIRVGPSHAIERPFGLDSRQKLSKAGVILVKWPRRPCNPPSHRGIECVDPCVGGADVLDIFIRRVPKAIERGDGWMLPIR